MMQLLFWVFVGLVLYVYVGYPIVLTLVARAHKRDDPLTEVSEWPPVSILIAAYNEEKVIRGRVENALAGEYPPDRLEVIVASDGCTDRTDEEVRSVGDDRVRLLSYPDRQGKASVLNKAIREIASPIVVLTDANTFFEPDALQGLVRYFADEDVGAVCGRLEMKSRGEPIGGANALHRKYEDFLKSKESDTHSCTGANGAIYAVRRSVYPSPPEDSITEDFAITLHVIQNGRRVVFADEAVAYEESLGAAAHLLRQKSRIVAGTLQTLWRHRGLLNPLRSPIAWQLFSHKLLRHLAPFFLMGAFAASTLLVNRGLYGVLFSAQVCFYGLAIVAGVLDRAHVSCGPLRIPYFFCLINLAALFGFVKFAFGWQQVTWRGARQP